MDDDFVAAASRLLEIRSTADRPGELARALDAVIDLVGPGFTVERFSSRGKPSALLYPGSARPHFRVLFNGHLDVVPGTDGQFSPRVVDDRLYARGAHDMKVAALVLAQVFRDRAASLGFPLGLQLVTDEEVGGYDGTGHQVERGVTADFVILGEQTGLRVVTESKGICQVRLEAVGNTAHAAYPWLGDNALLSLTAGIERLLARYPVPAAEAWRTTVNVARIATGNAAVNQVPADATAWLDIRFPATDADFAGRTPAELTSYLKGLSGLGVTVESLGAPHYADPAAEDVRLLQAAAKSVGYPGDLLRKHGNADGRFWTAAGATAVAFGPGGDGQHGPSEYVDLTSVEPYRSALTAFLQSLP